MFSFTEKEIEILAEGEHERWVKEKQAAGWSYAEGPKNEKRKLHPCIVPWELLPDEEQDKDRNAVKSISALLAKSVLRFTGCSNNYIIAAAGLFTIWNEVRK